MTRLSDDEFASIWRTHGNATRVAAATGMAERSVNGRRNSLRKKGFDLPTIAQPGYESRAQYQPEDGRTYPPSRHLDIDTGSIVVFSDAHRWPGEFSTAAKGLIEVIREIKPRVAIANGDIFDGATTGRHPPFGFVSGRPSVKQELEACQELLGAVEQAVPRGCELVYTIGNHELRFERNLAVAVPEYAGLDGFRLEHHFDRWDMAWTAPVNWTSNHPVMVKHRQRGGIHAGYQNIVHGGVTMVTGHTHSLEVVPFGNYRTPRYWGVQTGTLQNLDHPSFEYMEEGPPGKACSGFAVLTFHDGELLPPEIAQVIGNRCWFRGHVVAE